MRGSQTCGLSTRCTNAGRSWPSLLRTKCDLAMNGGGAARIQRCASLIDLLAYYAELAPQFLASEDAGGILKER